MIFKLVLKKGIFCINRKKDRCQIDLDRYIDNLWSLAQQLVKWLGIFYYLSKGD